MNTNSFGKVYVRRRSLPQALTLFMFIMPFFLSFFTSFLNLPGLVKYTIDVAWVLVLFLIILKYKEGYDKKVIGYIVFCLLFFIVTFVTYLPNFQSVFYFLWGVRNNFRYYVAFLAYAILLDKDDVTFCFKAIDVFFWINAAVSVFQFFALGYKQDNLGGIFGVDKGCNAYSLIFFSIVISKSVLEFLNKKESFIVCSLKCVTALMISAMAELKFFFVVFALIILLALLFTSFSWNKFIIVLVAGVFVIFSGNFLTVLFGEGSNISLDRIMELAMAENYASQEDLGRFSGISVISNDFLTDTYKKIFGLGLGNCDTSTFAICNTPFYQRYNYLHYNWFSSSFLLIELGYSGLLIYFMFFILCFLTAYKIKKHKETEDIYSHLAMIMSVLCVLLTFYNGSLRMEIAYLAYFILALPLIGQGSQKNKKYNLC